MKKEKIDRFTQGFACAVATLIRMNNYMVETDARELFSAGLGKYDLKKFRQQGVDEYDIEVFKKCRKELIR